MTCGPDEGMLGLGDSEAQGMPDLARGDLVVAHQSGEDGQTGGIGGGPAGRTQRIRAQVPGGAGAGGPSHNPKRLRARVRRACNDPCRGRGYGDLRENHSLLRWEHRAEWGISPDRSPCHIRSRSGRQACRRVRPRKECRNGGRNPGAGDGIYRPSQCTGWILHRRAGRRWACSRYCRREKSDNQRCQAIGDEPADPVRAIAGGCGFAAWCCVDTEASGATDGEDQECGAAECGGLNINSDALLGAG